MLARDAAIVAGSRKRPRALLPWHGSPAPSRRTGASRSPRWPRAAAEDLGARHPGTTAAGLAGRARAVGLAASGAGFTLRGAHRNRSRRRPGGPLALLAQDPASPRFPPSARAWPTTGRWGTIQSGHPLGPTPIFDHGLYGEGETIGILDTGLDVDSCYFSDPGVPLPVNVFLPRSGYGTAAGGAHRKIAAYDFLYPGGAFPPPCDAPEDPAAWDNQGHGTHVAGNASGDDLAHPLSPHDPGDGWRPAHAWSSRTADTPGRTTPAATCRASAARRPASRAILDEAYAQGARIHS